MTQNEGSSEDASRIEPQYRVYGYWVGEWQGTEWTTDYEAVCETFFDVRENEQWLQLSLERKNSEQVERKAGPDGNDWFSKEVPR